MDIKIGAIQYSLEEAFGIFNIASPVADHNDPDTVVFDSYGNYTFPTETSFSSPKCLLSVSKRSFLE